MASKLEIVLVKRRGGKEKRRRLAVPGTGQGFEYERRGNLTLVRPRNKSRWKDEERIFRSLVFDRAGRVVSVGLPKFFEHDQDPVWRADLDQALDSGEDVELTRKHDGALLIRSVIRDRVVFRTRNALDAEHFESQVSRLVSERYPALADPSFAAERSLHFEFVSPRQRVILPYAEEELILIGTVDHSTLALGSYEELTGLAEDGDLRLTERLRLAGDIAELKQTVDQMSGTEGLVVRWRAAQRLLKVHNETYLLDHRKRFDYHPQKILAACRRRPFAHTDELCRHLGIGREDPLHAYVGEHLDRFNRLSSQTASELDGLEEMVASHSSLTRKKFIEQVAAPAGPPYTAILSHLRAGERERAAELLEQHLAGEMFVDPTGV